MVNILFYGMPPIRPGKVFTTGVKNTGFGKAAARTKHGKFVLDFSESWLDAQASRLTHSAINRFMKKVRKRSKSHVVRPGVDIGVINNNPDSYVCAAHSEVSYKHTVSSTVQSSIADTKIYKNTFQTGIPTSKSLYAFARNYVLDQKSLVDSDRDYMSTSKRQSLTSTFGFNQRSYDFLLGDTFMSLKDYKFLFDRYKGQFSDRLAKKNIYGNILYEHLHLRIKSETDYYTTRFRLHLVKITNPSVGVEDLVTNTFHSSSLSDSDYAVPRDRQISDKPLAYEKLRCQVLTDLRCLLTSSIYFKDNCKIVKTFKRNLGPNDIWEFDYYLHYGPGLLLNKVFQEGDEKNYRFPYVSNHHPAGYFFILESKGDPRCSITRTSDGCNFDGVSPGRFNISFCKQLKFVRDINKPNQLITTREFISNDEDFDNDLLANYFTPDRQTKINVSWNILNTNRVENSTLPYQVRYGEGRLTSPVEAVKVAAVSIIDDCAPPQIKYCFKSLGNMGRIFKRK